MPHKRKQKSGPSAWRGAGPRRESRLTDNDRRRIQLCTEHAAILIAAFILLTLLEALL